MYTNGDSINDKSDAIIIENISKHFKISHEKRRTVFENIVGMLKGKNGYDEFWALKDINLVIKHGDTIGIIGENGSGKSTLLKIIAGVLYPDNGKIKVNGKIAPFLELGVGFQPELTAKENIYLYGAIMGIQKKEIAKRYDDILQFAELKKFENMKLKNFSSGMYMRLAFSTAIYTDPDIFLIDEVLAVGDESFQKKCLEKFDEFKREKKTIILVSHSLDLVKKICKDTILLNNGKIVSFGDSESAIEKYHELLTMKNKK